MYVGMYVCMYVCMYACMYVWMYICMYVCRHISYTYPFWNRTLGKDHFWVLTHDLGGCMAPYVCIHDMYVCMYVCMYDVYVCIYNVCGMYI